LKRKGCIGYVKAKDEELPAQDLSFYLWKAELNKELLAFWESMIE